MRKFLKDQCRTGLKSKNCSIIGSQWGDEGKGKLVDILAEKFDFCARFNGGANAGHTVVANGHKYAFHLLPCGILYPHCVNILGNGVVLSVQTLFEELKQLDDQKIDYSNRLIISDRCHIVTQMHLDADSANESNKENRFIGTTKRGIGPTYAAKANRIGIRAGDLKNWENFKLQYMELHKRLKATNDPQIELVQLKELRDKIMQGNMIQDTVTLINQALDSDNQRVLFEGANAVMLDIDFGTYPYVTSSNTWSGGICTGLGVAPNKIETTIGIAKAYLTRVGEGAFPTELDNELGQRLRTIGGEVGATTGRPRRCGWIDIPMLNYSNLISGYSSYNLTKLDVLDNFDEIKIGARYILNGKQIHHMPSTLEEFKNVKIEYETMPGWKTDISKIKQFKDLPQKAKDYVERIEQLSNIPISWIGTGPKREQTILKEL